MEKRGISAVIVSALLILLLISAIIIVYAFVKQFTSSSTSKESDLLDCLSEVNLEIIDSCYLTNSIKVIVKNNNGFSYESDFFSVIANGKSISIPSAPYSNLRGFERVC